MIDIAKPLKRKMKIKKDGGNWSWIDFKDVRLQTFCFICGLLGHGDRFCPKLYEGVNKEAEKPYGLWLRAQGLRAQTTVGQRWLLPESPCRSQTDKIGARPQDSPGSEDRGRAKDENDKNQPGKECGQCTSMINTEQDGTVMQTIGK